MLKANGLMASISDSKFPASPQPGDLADLAEPISSDELHQCTWGSGVRAVQNSTSLSKAALKELWPCFKKAPDTWYAIFVLPCMFWSQSMKPVLRLTICLRAYLEWSLYKHDHGTIFTSSRFALLCCSGYITGSDKLQKFSSPAFQNTTCILRPQKKEDTTPLFHFTFWNLSFILKES